VWTGIRSTFSCCSVLFHSNSFIQFVYFSFQSSSRRDCPKPKHCPGLKEKDHVGSQSVHSIVGAAEEKTFGTLRMCSLINKQYILSKKHKTPIRVVTILSFVTKKTGKFCATTFAKL
jgi:hypothetical protein